MGRKFLGSVFEPLLNNGFNLAILQSFPNVEYFIDRLEIWERGLAKIVVPSFKNLPDKLSKLAALFSSMLLRIFSTL